MPLTYMHFSFKTASYFSPNFRPVIFAHRVYEGMNEGSDARGDAAICKVLRGSSYCAFKMPFYHGDIQKCFEHFPWREGRDRVGTQIIFGPAIPDIYSFGITYSPEFASQCSLRIRLVYLKRFY